MILIRQHPFRGPLEGVGPENRDYRESSFLRSYDLAPLPPYPLTPVSKLDWRNIGRLRKRDNGRGGGVGRGEAKSRKPSP
jgi:hypothetical protein